MKKLIFSSSLLMLSSLHAITIHECIRDHYKVNFLLEEGQSRQFILHLPYGTVIKDGGIVTAQGQIFEDTIPYADPIGDWLPKRAGNNIAKAIEQRNFFDGTLAVLSSLDHDQWYHWLLQLMPRLKILADSGLAYDKIHIYKLKERWQKETILHIMQVLNIPADKLLEIDHETPIQAKQLLVPSVAYNRWHKERNVLPSWLKTFLTSTFLRNGTETSCPKRIYISRSKARVRRILNEKDLRAFLESKGFVTVQLEDLSIFDQARYFNNAEIIIGPHGSGLANVIFSKPLTKIVELNYIPRYPHFLEIANMMGCMHIPYSDSNNQDRYKDYSVNMPFFKKFCAQKLGIS